MNQFAAALLILALYPSLALADQNPTAPPDPCAGSTGILAIIDRPTFEDSACAAKPHTVVIEGGYTNTVQQDAGRTVSNSYPQSEIRFGLQRGWEFKVNPPTFNHQTASVPSAPAQFASGFGDLTVGIRKEFGYSDRWIWTADAAVTLPTGSPGFTDAGPDYVANFIAGYSWTQALGLGFQVGASSTSVPSSTGVSVRRFGSVNHSLVISDQLTNRLQAFAELWGLTHAGVDVGHRDVVDGGLRLIVNPNFAIDAELSRTLGAPGGTSTHSFGFGAGWKL